MGNGVGKLSLCFAGDDKGVSWRKHDIGVFLSKPLDEGLGHSFCYIRQGPPGLSTSKVHSDDLMSRATFSSISGAAISANTSTPLSTTLADCPCSNDVDKASAFASSDSFSSIPLQPIPRNSIPYIHSGPIPCSTPMERGFLSGAIERSFISCPLANHYDQIKRYRPKTKKRTLISIVKTAIAKSIVVPIRGPKEPDWADGLGRNNEHVTPNTTASNTLSTQLSLCDDGDDDERLFQRMNLQWAEGKAGEDRVHMVVSEEHGWAFVGIYDGFSGPDATDFLLTNLYSNLHKELKGLLWDDKPIANNPNLGTNSNSEEVLDGVEGVNHSDVLKALSEAMRKTEESYLQIADLMLKENPELCLMGSCALVMLMKGEDVYLMNVGDSRAVLARKAEPELWTRKARQDLMRINEETLDDLRASDGDELRTSLPITSLQLTMDHCTSVDEEVRRIRSEHRDDPSAVINGRVKGSLKVTRAFGAGYLKQPKWNNALLEMFRVDYVGNSPYINCLPSLHHHRLSSRDRFLILSSDGLYQYFTNEEVVSEVDKFLAAFPEGDPAQHLVEEVLFRAAKKAGMDFHELLDIPQGDRRRYHDDVSIIIISLKGRIWRSSI